MEFSDRAVVSPGLRVGMLLGGELSGGSISGTGSK